MVATHPEGKGAYLAMKAALKNADISVEGVDVISAHATSTKVGDFYYYYKCCFKIKFD